MNINDFSAEKMHRMCLRKKAYFTKAFAEKMEQLQQNGKRTDKDNIISHICTFPIPNTKEDLFEFIILAGANIRDDRYDDDLPKYKQEISDAWKSKFEQAYTKAKISFKNSPEFKEIESIYSSKITQQRKAKISAPIKTNLAIICSLLFTLLICGIILFGDYFIVSAENKRLESIVEEIYVHIEQEEYVLARSKAATLVFSGSTTTLGEQNSEKWDKTRTELLAIIDAALEGSGYEVQQPQENNKSEGGFWQGFFNGFDSGFK